MLSWLVNRLSSALTGYLSGSRVSNRENLGSYSGDGGLPLWV